MADQAPEPVPSSRHAPEDPALRAAYLDSVRAERRALSVLAIVATSAIVWIASPVGIGILLGTLLAFSLQPTYERLVLRTGRTGLTAIGCVIVSTFGLLAVFGGLFTLFIARGAVMAQLFMTSLAPGGAVRVLAQRLSEKLGPLKLQPDDLTAKLRDAATDVASRAASIAAEVATTTFEILLSLVFAMMTLSFILRHWSKIAVLCEDMLPLRPRYTRALLLELQRVGRATLLGTVLTGLAQGALSALGYWVTGVPEAAFFGAATAVASLMPGVGTLLVWVPAGIFLLATGSPAMGILELCWGSLVVVGASDYVIRPRLVGGHGTMPSIFTFIALFGGVEVLGLSGLIVGPLIVSLSFAVLKIFAQDAEQRRSLGERHA